MPTWGTMTEIADGLIMWALVNVLFVSFFLLGGWRRERCLQASGPSRPSAKRAFGVASAPGKTR
jgi:hypothetical protein